MINISTSTMSACFPLEPLLVKFDKNSYAHKWIHLNGLVIGLTDLRARSGTFTTPWNATSVYRSVMPDLSVAENRQLNELMDIRANEIYQESKIISKKIAVMWSGGIDSTAVLISFIKTIPAHEITERLVVCMSPDSALENLAFYRDYISNKLPTLHRVLLNVTDELLDDYIIVHGDPGDALFGPSAVKYKHLIPDQRHLLPYKDNVQLLYDCVSANGKFSRDSSKWFVDKINANLDEVNLTGVVTIADWFWWQYVNFKWEGSMWRPFHANSTRKSHAVGISRANAGAYLDNVFFNTDYFQQWSYTNLARLMLNGHKAEIKQYIYEFDKNEAFRKYKTKLASMPVNNTIGFSRPAFYDENWVGYSLSEPKVLDLTMELLSSYKG